MKALVTRRYDPLIWCAVCFGIAVVGFWWPFFLANSSSDSDSRVGMVMLFTSPFLLAAANRSIFAYRRLIIVSRRPEEEGLKPEVAIGFIFTIGAVLPAAWMLFSSVFFFHDNETARTH
jgi:hypothetical protein